MNYRDFGMTNLESDLTKSDSVKASVINIITTQKGSLPGKPEFGSDVFKYLFEPLNTFTIISLSDNIRSSLYRNDERLDTVTVNITPNKEQYSLEVSVEFTTIEDTQPQIITVNLQG